MIDRICLDGPPGTHYNFLLNIQFPLTYINPYDSVYCTASSSLVEAQRTCAGQVLILWVTLVTLSSLSFGSALALTVGESATFEESPLGLITGTI